MLWGEIAVGPRHCWRLGEAARGRVGVDGFVELFCAACVSGAVVAWLACLLGWAWYMSLCGGVGGVVWLGCETGTVLGDTAVHLPARTWGASHTPDDDLA